MLLPHNFILRYCVRTYVSALLAKNRCLDFLSHMDRARTTLSRLPHNIALVIFTCAPFLSHL
jgi:hypothetical protein